jgi:hypothetical protein
VLFGTFVTVRCPLAPAAGDRTKRSARAFAFGAGRRRRPLRAHSQGDIDLALLQMRAETVRRIDAALVRLEAGTYGSCVECAVAISEPRLRALPFAARCQACEERREDENGHARRVEQRRGSPSLFSEVVSS